MQKHVSGAEITINAPIDTVWHAITNSKIALMPSTSVESDWEVGDPITFEGEFNGNHFKDYGEIVDRQDMRAVAFSQMSAPSGDASQSRNSLPAFGLAPILGTTPNIGSRPIGSSNIIFTGAPFFMVSWMVL